MGAMLEERPSPKFSFKAETSRAQLKARHCMLCNYENETWRKQRNVAQSACEERSSPRRRCSLVRSSISCRNVYLHMDFRWIFQYRFQIVANIHDIHDTQQWQCWRNCGNIRNSSGNRPSAANCRICPESSAQSLPYYRCIFFAEICIHDSILSRRIRIYFLWKNTEFSTLRGR